MKYKKILLTGASGNLGQTIINSGYFPSLLTPPMEVLDITKPETIRKFFDDNELDAVIHCAALARMKECEEYPVRAIETNILGTSNLVVEVIRNEKKLQNKIRVIHISTDGVYAGTKGNYSEKDPTVPYNKYGKTKLGSECVVNLLSDFCTIRTSFFNPDNIKFDKSAVDAYSSKVPIDYLAKAISILIESDFVGIINVGGERKSDYERYKEFKPTLLPCKFKDIRKEVSFPMANDSSMDCSHWKKIEQENK